MDKHAAKAETENEPLVSFGKALFGFKEKEVFDYIGLLNGNLGKARAVYEEKLAELKNKNDMLSYENSSREEKLRQMTEEYQALRAERDELKKKVDSQGSREQELQSAYDRIRQMEEQAEMSRSMEEENRQLKKKIAETEAVCEARGRQQEELNREVETLKQQNQETLSKFLDERKRMEEIREESDLTLTKQLEMHRYVLNQARSALERLTAQFEESCKTADQIRVGGSYDGE